MPDLLKELGVPTSPPTGGTVPSLGSYGGVPEAEEGTLAWLLGQLERPALAVSQAYGAAVAGEDPITAGLGGFLRREREHGTMGEQLIPDSPDDTYDERVMKEVSRFGVGLATDPLMYAGALPARKAIGFGLRTASKVLGKIPVPQVLARYVIPMTHVFERWGAGAGKKIAVGLKQAYNAHKVNTGRVEHDFMKLLSDLKLIGNKGTPFRKAADDLLRGVPGTTPYHTDQRTVAIFNWMRTQLDEAGTLVEGYVDPTGKKFEVIEPLLATAKKKIFQDTRKLPGGLMGKGKRRWRKDVWDAWATGSDLPKENPAAAAKLMGLFEKNLAPTGYRAEAGGVSVWERGFHRQPWRKRTDYAPQMLNPQATEILWGGKPTKGYHAAVTQFAKELGVQEEQALDILRNMAMPKRAGNIEYARHLPFTETLFEKDPLIWFPKYMSRMHERVAYADQFGLNGQVLNSLYKTMRYDPRATIDKKWARDARDIILGKYQSDRSVAGLAQKIMGIQVVTKMGFLSSLSNLSQNSNTIVREGGVNFTKGILRSMTQEGRRQGYIAYQKGVQDQLIRLAGGQRPWAHKYLDYTLFNPVERLNRILAANAGVLRAEQLIAREGKLTGELVRRGLTADDLLATARNGGKLPTEVAERVGFLTSEATQHATHWKDLPVGWQDPFMRITTQYKNFVYQQSRFLLRDVLKPAKLYFESDGKKGSIAPLMRAFVTFGISAELVGQARSDIRGWAANLPKLWSADPLDYSPRERRDDYVVQLLEDGLHVGALGIAGDLVDRATYRDLSSWLLGPTFGDVLGFGEGAVQAANRMRKREEIPYEQYMAQLIRRIPGAPGVAPPPRALAEPATELLTLLGVR